MYENIKNICNVNQLHFIFDSYLSNSLKPSERLHRKSTPIELATITEETPLPAQMDKFWACDNNKIRFQKFPSNFILDHVTKTQGCITVTSGVIRTMIFYLLDPSILSFVQI